MFYKYFAVVSRPTFWTLTYTIVANSVRGAVHRTFFFVAQNTSPAFNWVLYYLHNKLSCLGHQYDHSQSISHCILILSIQHCTSNPLECIDHYMSIHWDIKELNILLLPISDRTSINNYVTTQVPFKHVPWLLQLLKQYLCSQINPNHPSAQMTFF